MDVVMPPAAVTLTCHTSSHPSACSARHLSEPRDLSSLTRKMTSLRPTPRLLWRKHQQQREQQRQQQQQQGLVRLCSVRVAMMVVAAAAAPPECMAAVEACLGSSDRGPSGLQKSTTATSTTAAANTGQACHGPQQQQPPKRVFGLSQVPRSSVSVEVHHLGLFKFKGNPQPLEMVNVMLSSLGGRAGFFPLDPPKGKGGRVAERAGLAGSVMAPLPVVAAQYRARVPLYILQSSAVQEHLNSGFLSPGGLRTNSLPARRSYSVTDDASIPGRRIGSSGQQTRYGNQRSDQAAAAARMGLVAVQGRGWRGSGSSSSNPSGGDDVASSPDAAAAASGSSTGSGSALRLSAGLRSKSVVTSRGSEGSSSYGNVMIPLAVLRQQQLQQQQQYGATSSSSYGNRAPAIKRVSEDEQF